MAVDMDLGDTRLIVSECMKQGLLRNQAAYVLATALWETGRTMEPVREAFWLSEEWRSRNLRYYPWYGRGYVQLTWERNYIRAGKELGVDLTTDPDVVMQPEYAVPILVVGMKEGWFTRESLDDYITLKRSNYRGARRIVNGTDKAATIAEIAREYEEALVRDGYGVEKTPPRIEDRRDGTKPRETPAQSTTIWATVSAALGYLGTVTEEARDAVGQVTETFGIPPQIVFFLVVFGALAWITRERWRKWLDGDR